MRRLVNTQELILLTDFEGIEPVTEEIEIVEEVVVRVEETPPQVDDHLLHHGKLPLVWYVLDSGRSRGDRRLAAVVRNFNGEMLNLGVLYDGSNDFLGVGTNGNFFPFLWKTSVHYSKEHLPNTWHHIEE